MWLRGLKRRRRRRELIDSPDALSRAETLQMLDELTLVNRWLGGVSACRKQVVPILRSLAREHPGRECRILDLGTGGADLAAEVSRWAQELGLPVRLVAIDFNPTVCEIAARRVGEDPKIHLVCADVHRLPLRNASFDLVLCSAFLHHFSDREIKAILRDLGALARGVVVWIDLQRSVLAFAGIRLLTALFSKSQAVRNDGPLSVQKGFTRRELSDLVQQSGLDMEQLHWRWAFRFALTAQGPRGQTAAPRPGHLRPA